MPAFLQRKSRRRRSSILGLATTNGNTAQNANPALHMPLSAAQREVQRDQQKKQNVYPLSDQALRRTLGQHKGLEEIMSKTSIQRLTHELYHLSNQGSAKHQEGSGQ